MNHVIHNNIVNFIWGIADDVLRDLKNRAKQQQLKADFEAYLDGFSPNVRKILDKFKFLNQIPTLIEADILGHLIEKFLVHRPAKADDGGRRRFLHGLAVLSP